MRVLHIHNQIENKGGAEIYLKQLQDLLPTIGHKTWWIAIQQKQDNWRWCEPSGEWVSASKQQLIENVARWMDVQEIDLICLHNLFDNDLVDRVSQLRPTIKFCHSPVAVCPGKDKYWRYSNTGCTIPYGMHCFLHAYTQGCTNRHPKRLLHDFNFVKRELERCRSIYKKIIVMSEYNYRLLQECGVQTHKITINPYFTPHRQKSAGFQSPKRLLFIGRLINGKGADIMIGAVEHILKEEVDIKLDIVGDGPELERLKKLVADRQLTQQVCFHGWLSPEETDKVIESCYLLIFPSVYPESFGIVGIEALMAGKPVVGFDVGGVSSWLRHNENGLICKPRDQAAMASNIRLLINDITLYERLSENAYRCAVVNFLPGKHLQVLDAVFSEAVMDYKMKQSVH